MQTREQSLKIAREKQFDLVVIGGGITGAGVAQNAASRGLSVLVIEKTDFGAGTSSKTTKLIHGGLRYLEQFHFNLTRQLCEERERLKRLAPHLVKDFSFVLPFTRGQLFFNMKASVGIGLYDLLTMTAGRTSSHAHLSKKAVFQTAPALSPDIVTGGIKFHDAITDDTRMVLTVFKSAFDHGAILVNYVDARGLKMEGGRIVAVDCHDRFTGEDFTVSCKACVNATGVWTDEICNLVSGEPEQRVTPSKGTHIIVPSSAFETNTALFLPTTDGRFVFVVPWLRALMIGTTDEAYTGDINSPRATAEEMDYLLSVANSYTKSSRLSRADIIGSFAGLRPLVKLPGQDSDNTSAMSREHLIFEAPGKLINVAGGKLTSYRLMAEEIIDHVAKLHPELKPAASRTGELMLGGWKNKDDYLNESAAISARARRLTLDPATIDHLIANYGAEATGVLDLLEQNSDLGRRICIDFPPIFAEIPFCVEHEMAVSLSDVMFRRLRLGLLNHNQAMAAAPAVARVMQQMLGWDEHRVALELEVVESEIPSVLQTPVTQS
ncbi:MAG: glycerol-3-phosphate dehydrogenase/oxidase [Candidatus Obscuribacterales bacterium]|nr:glycerol-3-phosphate dehydrogenase/oxidase [Candidatus Obscuribacterales bacterium]